MQSFFRPFFRTGELVTYGNSNNEDLWVVRYQEFCYTLMGDYGESVEWWVFATNLDDPEKTIERPAEMFRLADVHRRTNRNDYRVNDTSLGKVAL